MALVLKRLGQAAFAQRIAVGGDVVIGRKALEAVAIMA